MALSLWENLLIRFIRVLYRQSSINIIFKCSILNCHYLLKLERKFFSHLVAFSDHQQSKHLVYLPYARYQERY